MVQYCRPNGLQRWIVRPLSHRRQQDVVRASQAYKILLVVLGNISAENPKENKGNDRRQTTHSNQ